MKKTLSFILSLVMVIGIITSVPVTVSAASVDDLTFELNENGESYSVTSCSESAEGEIVIPSTYNGLPVTEIGYASFECCEYISSVTIPNSVTTIRENAFYGCTNLASITIPDSVTRIEGWVFDDTAYYDDWDNWDDDGVLYISGHLIEANDTLSGEYAIKEGTKSIATYAFYSCDSLTSVTIPNSVTNIGYGAFSFCCNLTSINVDSENTYYTSVDGVLFNIDKTTLVRYPAGKIETSYVIPEGVTSIDDFAFYFSGLTSITVPDSVTSIGDYAFFTCTNLITFNIPDSVTNIGSFTFYDCESLTSVTIPDSITSMEFGAFSWCINLTDVYYSGSLTQWKNIAIDYQNDELINANIHFAIVENPPEIPKLTSVSRASNGVKVNWDRILGADSYIVYRKTSKSGWTRLGVVTTTAFTDTKAKTGTTYYYTVKAQNEAGASGYNKTGLKIKYVAAPKLTKITNEASGVRVYWSKVAGADGYYLYRRVAGTKSWTKIATIKKGTTTSYKDTKASAGKTYEYIIKCYDGSTPSASAAKVIKIKRLTVPKLVSTSSSKTGITFKWGKVSGAEGYYVYRKTGSGSWVKLTTVKGNTKVSYVDKSAKKGKTYTYTVRAYSGSYTSAYNTKGLKIKDKY